MQLENTGKQISKIKINKKKVTLTFLDNTKLDISYDAYSENYLFVGKVLSSKEIKKIKEVTSLEKGLNYAFSILNKSHISEHTLREKLYKKEYVKPVVDAIIIFLKDNDLINDKMYALDYIEYANEMCIGKNKIIDDLKRKGVFIENIKGINFSNNNELRKAKSLIPNLEKKYNSLNYQNKRKHIFDSLIIRGFDFDIATEAIKNIKTINVDDELVKLNKDFKLILDKAKRKQLENYEFDKFMKESLIRKGYKLKDIKKLLEEYYEISR